MKFKILLFIITLVILASCQEENINSPKYFGGSWEISGKLYEIVKSDDFIITNSYYDTLFRHDYINTRISIYIDDLTYPNKVTRFISEQTREFILISKLYDPESRFFSFNRDDLLNGYFLIFNEYYDTNEYHSMQIDIESIGYDSLNIFFNFSNEKRYLLKATGKR